MGNTSFAGLGGGAVAGAAVAVAVAIVGFVIYDKAVDNPPEDQTVEAVLQPKPEAVTPKAEVAVEPAATATQTAQSIDETPSEAVKPVAETQAPPAAAAESVKEPEATPEVTPQATDDGTLAKVETTPEANAETAPIADKPVAEADVTPAETSKEAIEDTAVATDEQPTAAPTAAPLDPPRFDVVRVDAEGNALIAGSAAPESEIAVLLDRTEIASTASDRSGKFVALFEIAPSSQPRSVTLVMTAGDVQLASVETVVIEPVVAPAPVVVAEAQNTPETRATEVPASAETPSAAVTENEAAPEVSASAPQAETPVSEAPVTAEVETVEMASEETTSSVTEPPVEAVEPAPQSPAAPRVLIADAEGVRVLSDPAKQVDISIDTISYSAAGNAVVAGRGQVGAIVRLYLNGAATAETPVSDTGNWSVELQDVTPGVYTLRADQLDGEGSVTSRVETPFKRESQEVLAAVQTPTPDADIATAAPESNAAETAQDATEATTPDVAQVNVVTVQPGFTLWGIAAERYGDGYLYVKVFDANADQIRNPDLIYPGQVFTVPE